MRRAPIILLLLFILTLIANKFFYYDFEMPNNCFIKVVPSFLPSNLDTKKVLRVIKNGAPESYKQVCSRVNTINKNPGCGGFDGGCFYENKSNTIYIGNDQGNIALAAALVMHETCHATQYQENRSMSEIECYGVGSEFLKEIQVY